MVITTKAPVSTFKPTWNVVSSDNDSAESLVLRHVADIRPIITDFFYRFHRDNPPVSALQFLPVMTEVSLMIRPLMIQKLLKMEESKHILIQNDLMKVVLIRWEPGEISSIHGHPKGGCVFKVLCGSVEEMRYTDDPSPKLLVVSQYQAGAAAYIDDSIALHAVGNSTRFPAVSLHAYAYGK